MKLITLGTGGPRPDPDRGAACTVLEVGGKYLYFDTGRGVVRSSARKGIPFADIAALFLTHHHFDHIGELPDFLISSWLAGRRGAALPAFGPPGTADIHAVLMQQVYDKDLEFRTAGEQVFGDFVHAEFREVRAGPVTEVAGCRVSCEEMTHGHGLPFGPLFRRRWICLGYRVETQGKVVTISGDGVMSEALLRLARGSDLHVQCCYMAASDLVEPHFRRVSEHTLACSDTVGKIAAAAGVKKLVLTHFRQMAPEKLAEIERDVRADFSGDVMLARDLDEFAL